MSLPSSLQVGQRYFLGCRRVERLRERSALDNALVGAWFLEQIDAARKLLDTSVMQKRTLGFIGALLFAGTGCGSTVEFDEPQVESVGTRLLANDPGNCTIQYRLDGAPLFDEPLRVNALRVVADEGVAQVEVWLAQVDDPDEVFGCPERAADDIVLYDGPPTTDVVEFGPRGPLLDVGTAVVLDVDRAPCDNAACELRELEVDVELELLPR